MNAGDLHAVPAMPLDGKLAAPPLRRGRSLPGLGRAGIAALLTGGRTAGVPDALEHVVRQHRVHHPRADIALLARAYSVAEASHRGQTRKSGEPYITHPLAVTMILSQLGAGTTTLVAALLHDTVEDTAVTLDEVRAGFGDEVAYLVDGVTKLEKVDFGAAAEAETFRKMLVATGEDVRVMVIKLADRLHNMRTIRHMKPASQIRIAKVTRDVLIPLAERLGIQVVKTELEDIVFATLHPDEYARTRELIARHEARDAELGGGPLAEFAERVRRQLREARIPAEVGIRPRHCVSVQRVRLNRAETGSTDLGRLLIVVEENADCYAVLGELHTCWTPLPGEFKDFVATPKFNLYQSLHTAVATEDGEVVEVLVRTQRMHRVAEFGVVALDGAPTAADPEAEALEGTEGGDPGRPGWLSRLLEWQRETPDPDTFWDQLREDLSRDGELTVLVAGHGGAAARPLQLPVGATGVDAAYALGEETGHRCIGARLNGRLSALSVELHDGDLIDLLTEDPQDGAEPGGPGPDWLAHAHTPAARIAIERWLADHPAPETAAPRPLPDAGPQLTPGGEAPVPDAVAAPAMPRARIRLAGCCTPVPPDPLLGFAVRGGTLTVHREDCPTAQAMRGKGRRPVEAHWTRVDGEAGYRVTVQAEALTRPRLLADLTAAISSAGVDILSATVEPPQELRVRHVYTVELPDAEALPGLMRAMQRVPGVYDVYRAGEQPSGQAGDRAGNGGDRVEAGMRPSTARGMRDDDPALSSVGE
ncbi:RelA/SpoT family protein [Streptacidiphilus monticola]|uniref:RelA/SpoT family protein n=1 Tax=Streptacidiphilus monticola TaxID=2161674 RepID=A0ABW1G687_9ACTN